MTPFHKKLLLTLLFILLSISVVIFVTFTQQNKPEKEAQSLSIKNKEIPETNFKQNIKLEDELINHSFQKDISLRRDECEKAAHELFPSKDSFNIESGSFKNPQRVIEKLHDTFRTTLFSKEGREIYQTISEQNAKSEDPLTKKMLKHLNATVVCRPLLSTRYIKTVLRAYKEMGWAEQTRQEIVYVITTMMMNITENNFAPLNIEFIYETILQLIEHELISKKEENVIRTAYENFKAAKVNNELKSFKTLEDEGHKVHLFLKHIKTEYAPDYR